LDDTAYDLNCDAPKGYLWRSNGCGTICIAWANNSQTWLTKALADAQQDLKMGLDKAHGDQLADLKHNNDDDTWEASADAPERIEWL
jgi:hypothetical protein